MDSASALPLHEEGEAPLPPYAEWAKAVNGMSHTPPNHLPRSQEFIKYIIKVFRETFINCCWSVSASERALQQQHQRHQVPRCEQETFAALMLAFFD
ncbi:unnamed protein product [Ceratitis capitata]|uniref:(Mediterranean fruit fly) hypothetical protein n=1 Tax=Ceratitis capitata TaxID=7213 RepID=A0A811V4Y1_CERCA|nr:unnamed protein product [Ceratitis capitata]